MRPDYLSTARERKEALSSYCNPEVILKRLVIVTCTCLAVQFGAFPANAAMGESGSVVDEIFESSFDERASEPAPPPPPPAPVAPVPNVVPGSAGQSLFLLPIPEPLSLPPVILAGPGGESRTGVAGSTSAGHDASSSSIRAFLAKRLASEEPVQRATAGSRYGARRVSSTAYCLTGTMASGRRVYHGAVAMNGTPIGSRYQVLDGPRAGETFVVEDRIGHGSGFDIAYPGDCRGANNYGRRTIAIRQV
ncbi:MAG: hypothetical protein ACT4OM_12080 [Actinomycetota bacterium]